MSDDDDVGDAGRGDSDSGQVVNITIDKALEQFRFNYDRLYRALKASMDNERRLLRQVRATRLLPCGACRASVGHSNGPR